MINYHSLKQAVHRFAQRVAAVAAAFALTAALPHAVAAPQAAHPAPIPLINRFVQDSADAFLASLPLGSAPDDAGRVQLAYKALIEHTAFTDPAGLDVWRWRGPAEQTPPDFTENRAISPLLFGIGSCEDYAAAMAVLCRRLGYEARYVPGLTISVDGVFVDHAWTAVQLGETWYHLDAQLEDNVVRGGKLTYRFFLKDDRSMLADHRWGDSLWVYYGRPQTEKARLFLEQWSPPDCPSSVPTPAAESVESPGSPQRTALLARLDAEKRQYEAMHAPLPPLELDVTPPDVFLNRY